MAGKKGWWGLLFLAVVWMLIVSLVRDVNQLQSGFNRIRDTEARLVAEQDKNRQLKQKMSLVVTSEYEEKLIREKLNMQKTGEIVAILPKKLTDVSQGEVYKTTETGENWQKWLNLVR